LECSQGEDVADGAGVGLAACLDHEHLIGREAFDGTTLSVLAGGVRALKVRAGVAQRVGDAIILTVLDRLVAQERAAYASPLQLMGERRRDPAQLARSSSVRISGDGAWLP
jgi:hypothetical protein